MMSTQTFTHLTAQQVNTIRQYAGTAEQQGKLTAEQLQLIYDQHWFKMLAPVAYGGLELSLPHVVQLEEDLAHADGSLGWAVTLCAGAGWFGGFTDPEFSKQIFTANHVCLAGSGAPSGFADIVPHGYRVTGKWLHATGAQHATVFTANCIIRENNVPVLDNEGNEMILSFTFLKDEVSVLPGWPYIGMRGTSSYRYEVNNVVVPYNRTFKIDAKEAHINAPLYQYPFMQLAWATLAINISGMALHFIELAEKIFDEKKNRQGVLLKDLDVVKNAFYIHLQQLNSARAAFYDDLNQSWEMCVNNGRIDKATCMAVNTTAHLLSETAKRTVDSLYPYCGLAAANPGTQLNRVWRDIHTAGQHSLLVFGSDK